MCGMLSVLMERGGIQIQFAWYTTKENDTTQNDSVLEKRRRKKGGGKRKRIEPRSLCHLTNSDTVWVFPPKERKTAEPRTMPFQIKSCLACATAQILSIPPNPPTPYTHTLKKRKRIKLRTTLCQIKSLRELCATLAFLLPFCVWYELWSLLLLCLRHLFSFDCAQAYLLNF